MPPIDAGLYLPRGSACDTGFLFFRSGAAVMKTRQMHLTCAIVGALVPTISVAKEPKAAVVVEPNGPWQADYGNDRCRLGRLMKSGSEKYLFYIDQWGPGRSIEWGLAGKAMSNFQSTRKATYMFGPDGNEEEFGFTDATLGDFGSIVSTYAYLTVDDRIRSGIGASGDSFNAIDREAAGKLDRLTVSQKGRAPVVANFGKLEKPLAVLENCIDTLATSWGLTIADQKRVQTRASISNLSEVASKIQEQYPVKAVRKGAQANFDVRLIVAADGTLSSCTLTNKTKADDFEFKPDPCEIFYKHAKFEPARTASGEPVKSYIKQTISYRTW